MHYKRPVVDFDTGEKSWLELGDHLPLTDVAKKLGVGSRHFRQALIHMSLLQREWDDRSKQHRHRLTPGAVQSGFGIRHDNKGFQYDPDRSPFDVLSPVGVEYIGEHLPAALVALNELPAAASQALAALKQASAKRRSPMSPAMRVYWLADHYPDLDAAHVAKGLGISETLVHRYRARRDDQIRRTEQSAAAAGSWWPTQVTVADLAQAATAEEDLLAAVET